MLSHYANAWYSGGAGASMQPLNLLDRAVSVLGPLLISNNPRVLILAKQSGSDPNAKTFAIKLKYVLHDLFDEIKLAANTLRPTTIDSLFGLGITKTGVMHSHTVELGGYLHDYGQPYCDRVDFADYICDRNARNRQEMKFEGHRYRLPIQYVAESGLFKNYDNLTTNLRLYGQRTHPDEVSKGASANKSDEEIYPTVELIDLWLPDQDVVVTIPPEGQGDKYCREIEWDGPETGPFDVLGYKYFPDTVIPIPPAYMWVDQNKTVNVVINKMKDMVEREKTIAVGDLTNPQDKQVIKDSGHGDFVLLQGGADSVKEVTFGGFNPQSFPFLQFLLAEYSRSGPNLNLMGGKQLQATTLGQEQMLQANAQREVDDMLEQVYAFTESVVNKLAWFLTNGTVRSRQFTDTVGGIDAVLEFNTESADNLREYGIKIEPYSLGRMNPELRYQRILQLLSQIVIPLAPLAAQQGSYPSVDAIVHELGEYLNVDTDNWWRSLVPQQTAPAGPNQPLAGSAKSGQDNRFDMGTMEASRLSNLSQQQTRAPQKSSAG